MWTASRYSSSSSRGPGFKNAESSFCSDIQLSTHQAAAMQYARLRHTSGIARQASRAYNKCPDRQGPLDPQMAALSRPGCDVRCGAGNFDLGAAPTTKEAQAISDELYADFVSEDVDKVEMIYTKFVSLIASDPIVQTLLPLTPQASPAQQILQKPPALHAHHRCQRFFPALDCNAAVP